MRETVTKQDYVGFNFNGIHSSQFGLLSVSNGNRYSKSLLPNFKDSILETDSGTYYFGSKFQNREFDLTVAFDDVTESELREISSWLYNGGKISSLIFDELPYKKYFCKCSSSPDTKYLTFDSESGRIYKGEISIKFIAYDPYAYIVDKWLDNYTDDNKEEWQSSSGLLDNKKLLPEDLVDYFDVYANGKIPLYNPGDVETDFIIDLTIINTINNTITISLNGKSLTVNTINLKNGSQLIIDTKKRLIKNDSTIVNHLMSNGDFFKIPVDKTKNLDLSISNGASAATITYAYKYI